MKLGVSRSFEQLAKSPYRRYWDDHFLSRAAPNSPKVGSWAGEGGGAGLGVAVVFLVSGWFVGVVLVAPFSDVIELLALFVGESRLFLRAPRSSVSLLLDSLFSLEFWFHALPVSGSPFFGFVSWKLLDEFPFFFVKANSAPEIGVVVRQPV